MSLQRAPALPVGEGGLTLIEVVVAVLVLSVGLLAVAGMTLSAGTQARRAGLYTDRTLLAQERLGRIAAQGWHGTTVGTTVETVERGGTVWEVTQEVTLPAPGYKEVTLTVGGISGMADAGVTVRLARPRPLHD